MKHNTIILSLIAILILTQSAHSDSLTTWAWGSGKGGVTHLSSPDRLEINAGNPLYLYSPYPGTINLSLAVCSSGTNQIRIEVLSLNQSGITETWTSDYQSPYENCSGAVYNYTTFDFQVNTNTGIIQIARYVGSDNVVISLVSSSAIYEITDYTFKNFSAGGTYSIPVVNKYYPGQVLIDDYPDSSYANHYYQNKTGSTINQTQLTLDCNIPTGEHNLFYTNLNTTSGASDLTLWKAYVTERTPLNFTAISPPNNTKISIPVGGTANFSIVPNVPESVDAVVWYEDSDILAVVYNYTYSYTSSDAGVHIIEVQLEDEICSVYPTAIWEVYVGETATIKGTVKDLIGNPLIGATVILGTSTGQLETTTNSTGGYIFYNQLCDADTTTYVYASYPGYTTGVKEVDYSLCGLYNNTFTKDFELSGETNYGKVQIYSYDYPTNGLLTNYDLNLYRSGQKMLTISNGVVTYNVSTTYYQVNSSGNPTTITNLPIPYNYTVTINKTGYAPTGISGYPSTTLWTATDSYTQIKELYLQESVNITTQSVNWSNIQPTNGSTINASETPTIYLNGTYTTDNKNLYTICLYSKEEGYPWGYACTPNQVQGTGTISDYIILESNTDYYFYFTAKTGVYQFTSGIYTFNTTGTTTTTSTTIITLHPTTTTTYSTTTTTIWNISQANATNIGFNCTNLTGKLKQGDVFHCAVCPFIMVLGVSLFYGLTLLFILLAIYKLTGNLTTTSVLGLLYTSLYLQFLPQPTLNYLTVGVGFTLFLGLYDLWRRI